MKRVLVLLAASVVLLAACTESEPQRRTGRDPTGVAVPDVTHMDLRTAYQALRDRGFQVAFARGIPRAARRYALGASRDGLSARLMALRPKPGVRVSVGSAITVTTVTCSAGPGYSC